MGANDGQGFSDTIYPQESVPSQSMGDTGWEPHNAGVRGVLLIRRLWTVAKAFLGL